MTGLTKDDLELIERERDVSLADVINILKTESFSDAINDVLLKTLKTDSVVEHVRSER